MIRGLCRAMGAFLAPGLPEQPHVARFSGRSAGSPVFVESMGNLFADVFACWPSKGPGAVLGGGATASAGATFFYVAVLEKHVEGPIQRGGGGFGQLALEFRSGDPAVPLWGQAQKEHDALGDEVGWGADRMTLVDEEERAVKLDTEVCDQVNGPIERVMRQRLIWLVRVSQGVKDEVLAIEAACEA